MLCSQKACPGLITAHDSRSKESDILSHQFTHIHTQTHTVVGGGMNKYKIIFSKKIGVSPISIGIEGETRPKDQALLGNHGQCVHRPVILGRVRPHETTMGHEV